MKHLLPTESTTYMRYICRLWLINCKLYCILCRVYLTLGMLMKVKNNLKVWRAKRDITQQQLANAVELSRQTVNSIEKGKFIPSVYTALKIAKYFNTTIEEIFNLNIKS